MMSKLLSLLLLSLLATQAGASVFFKVVEPSELQVTQNEDTNFTATVKSLGSDGRHVCLIFRDLPPGISIEECVKKKWIYPGGLMDFNHTMSVGEVPPGNYTFQIGIAARGAPTSWHNVTLIIEPILVDESGPSMADANESEFPRQQENVTEAQVSENEMEKRAVSGFGAALAAIIIILLARRDGD